MKNYHHRFLLVVFRKIKVAKEFSKILQKFEIDHSIAEWYQFDRQGSRLGLDAEGNVFWLIVRSQEDIEKGLDIARGNHASKKVIQALENKTHLLFLFSEIEKHLPVTEWDKYIFSVIGSVGKHGINYAIIRDNYFSLDRSRIVSYNDYLASVMDS